MILEIPIQVLRSDICISSHNLTKQIHLTIALSVSDKSVNVIYFNGPSFTSIQQNTTNTGIVCMSPNFQRDSTICQYWKQTVEILLGHSHCLPLLQNSYLNDWWNHLYNGKSLLLQIINYGLSLEIVMILLVQTLPLKDGSAFNLPLIFKHLLNPVVTVLAEDWVTLTPTLTVCHCFKTAT